MHSLKSSEFESVMSDDVISLDKLRRLAYSGCPFRGSWRSLTWRLLLNYLPVEHALWDNTLKKHRSLYDSFLQEMIILPEQLSANNDHPLNPNPESGWSSLFKDNEMLLQIDKDCRRLCPAFNFFQQASEFPRTAMCSSLRRRVEQTTLKAQDLRPTRAGTTSLCESARRRVNNDNVNPMPDGQEAHWEVCQRILFVYGKLNPGQGYVQGMNELVGPLYYVMATDPDYRWREHAEADAFFCFTTLMGEIRDNFIKVLDYDSNCGIGAKMQAFSNILKKVDFSLWRRLEELNLKLEFYSFRWITLLLSQEFELPDVIRLWDSLFADENRYDFLLYVMCAMLILVRGELMTNDFSETMKLVQKYPLTDVHVILAKANELYMRREYER